MLGMRRRLPLLATITFLAGSVLTPAAGRSAAGAGHLPRAVCGPSSARTIAGDAVARVYAFKGHADGCVAGARRSYRLGATGISLRVARVEAVRVVGRIAAYGLRVSGVDTGYAIVNVRRLTTGAFLAQRPATTRVGVEAFQSIDSLVLKRDGAVAWIATARSIGKPTFIRQLQRSDARGVRVLDSGAKLAARSLALHGSTLSWRHGTAVRTARLD